MKQSLILLLSCIVLISCADDKYYAPKEGRISIFETQNPQISTGEVKIKKAITNNKWTAPFYNTQNNQPNLLVKQLNTPEWEIQINEKKPQKNRLIPTPLINGDNVYALDSNYSLTKIELKTGNEIWKIKLANNKTGMSLALTSKNIIALSTDGLLTSISFDGKQLWQKDYKVTTKAPLLLDHNTIYLLTAHNQLIVLNTQTGKELWRYQTTKTNTGLTIMAPPAKKNNILIVPFTTGEVMAFDSDSGLLKWIQIMIGNRPQDLTEIPQIAAAPVIDEETVYITGNANLTGAYDLTTGETKWTNTLASIITPIISGNTLFLMTTKNELVALDKNSGKIFWKKIYTPKEESTWNNLSLINNQLFLNSTQEIISIDTDNGELIQTKSKSIYAKPVVANELLIITDKESTIQTY